MLALRFGRHAKDLTRCTYSKTCWSMLADASSRRSTIAVRILILNSIDFLLVLGVEEIEADMRSPNDRTDVPSEHIHGLLMKLMASYCKVCRQQAL